jgi:exodeoxyribonuclease VII small subunit
MASKRESYEGMISKLEDIVSSMENGEMTLEDTMGNYEAGVTLCNKLYKYLNEAEGRIKILSGEKENDFPGNEE